MPPLNRDDSVLYFPPEAFGPYRVLHQIGAGTLGPVFRGFEPERDRLVAIKVFRLEITPEGAEALAQALNELVAIGLTHPALAAPLGAGVEGSVAYLAQEHVVGESLDVALRERGAMPLADALSLVEELAGVIDAADRRRVNHGLLHPRDVILASDGPRVTGFGIARALTQVGVRLPVRLPYSAPERIKGADWGRLADVFALAAITHELLMGRRVAGTGSEAAGSLSEIDGIDNAALRETFASALAPDPGARYEDARAFSAALHAAAHVERIEIVEERDAEVLLAARREPVEEAEGARAGMTGALADAAADQPVTNMSNWAFDESAMPDLRMTPEAVDGDNDMSHQDSRDHPIARGAPEEMLDLPRPRVWENVDPPKALQGSAQVYDHTRVAMLPVAITLVVGLLAGFMAGYGFGSRERASMQAVGTAPPVTPVNVPSATVQTLTVERGGNPSVAGAPVGLVPIVADAPKPTPPPPAPKPTPAAPRAPVTVQLLVRSTPAGAQVSVNGTPRGVTPLTLSELAPGSYTIRLTRQGYVAQERRLRLTTARRAASLAVTLRRVPAARDASGQGSLSVASRPAGARVFVNNRLLGTTPLTIPALPAGSAAVRIEQGGYQPWASTVQILAGERSRVTASLDRSPTR